MLLIGSSSITLGQIHIKSSESKIINHRDTLYVGGSGPNNYSTIQLAVNAAGPGDTIRILSGLYQEDVIIDKSDLTLIGDGAATTIVKAANTTTYGVFRIGFDVSHISIAHLTIRDHIKAGIYLGAADDITISYCIISHNTFYGINCDAEVTNSIFENNIISDNSVYGILLDDSSTNNILTHNIIHNGISYAIKIDSGSNHNTIQKNTITSNEANAYGIRVSESTNNHITQNNITHCPGYGILLTDSLCTDNLIYHNNFIDNHNGGVQAADYGSNNQWDDNYPSGGNYWDDYTGEDLNGDGIGDTPYDIDGGTNQDRYPLMDPWSEEPSDQTYIPPFFMDESGWDTTPTLQSTYSPLSLSHHQISTQQQTQRHKINRPRLKLLKEHLTTKLLNRVEPLIGYQRGDADANKDTGYLYVRAETYANPAGNYKVYAGAALIGCTPQNKYFQVPETGTYTITFNAAFTQGQVDNIVQIFYKSAGNGFSYGEAILEGQIYRWDDETTPVHLNKHTFYYKTFTVDGNEFLYNFKSDPPEITLTLEDITLSQNTDYFFTCLLAMAHEVEVPVGEAKADGQLKMHLNSVQILPVP
jgi:parallel beta-helix repeat protein